MSRPSKQKNSRRPLGKKTVGTSQRQAAREGSAPTRRPKRRRGAAPRINFDQDGERLQKVLAAAGVASRREAEQIILEGRVEVDGQTVLELGTRVDPHTQSIQVDGEPLNKPKLAYFAVNKPEGVVCTANDPSGRTRVIDLLPPDVGRVYNVGRLDINSEGLILCTNDGQLANQLTHPRHGVEKTYEVQVAGHLDVDVLKQLRSGMHLAEGFVRVVHVRIKSKRKNATVLEMVLDEGRNREIRRLLAKVGHRVQRLKRVAVGPIRLGEMPAGVSRRLTPEEVRKLRTYVRDTSNRPSRDGTTTGRPAGRQEKLKSRQRKRLAAAGKANAGRAAKQKPARTTKAKRGAR